MERVSESDVEAAEPVPGAHLKLLAGDEAMNVQHFEIAAGATVPEHSHPHEQAGYITSGEAVFLVDGEEIHVQAGDAYSIPGGEPHGLENRGEEPVVGVDIFSPPRENPDWEE
ncbi:cupin domain-containing protein [Halanaeroarchaeum sulfurireducens]|uniref:Cupin n=1 Tax=Halanaeroarchaeum sulfurireducens TaxID=1604004 RepID=A0A0F7PGG3_9EURY|nr:cupin domain-containing protein [Halanaeroarchaeum sulfurireducens]AKH98393.1 cupin [Halanaeroarchaeum sulfurireducens]ALG82787.1 cupin [Halanaeroarchaeum sulfurireducens]